MKIFDKIEYDLENYDDIFLNDYLFFDIETVTDVCCFDELNEVKQKAWLKSATKAYKNLCYDKDGNELPNCGDASYRAKGMLFPEYNKVVCISIGRFHNNKLLLHKITLNDGTEEEVIARFAQGLRENTNLVLVGYNIIGFDIPVLFKKMLKYQIKIPHQLRMDIKKPWELSDIIKDIFVLWRGGRYDYFPSFSLACDYVGIKTSKGIMDGSKVNDYFYEEIDGMSLEERIDLIGDYCNEDVRATADLFLYLKKQDIY